MDVTGLSRCLLRSGVSPLSAIALFLGPVVLVVVILMVVFALVRRAIDRDAAALAAEGIERDSGRVTVTIRFRKFRVRGGYRGGLTVGILDRKLHLRSDDPPGATGSIDFRVALPDPEGWVAALRAAGTRAAAST